VNKTKVEEDWCMVKAQTIRQMFSSV